MRKIILLLAIVLIAIIAIYFYNRDEGTKDSIVLEGGLSSIQKTLLPDKPTYMIQVSPTDGVEIEWSSSNEAVASIDSTGTATLLSKGSTTITAASRSHPQNFDSVELIVSEIEISIVVTGVERHEDTVRVELDKIKTIQLKVRISGGDSNQFTWSTTNPEVVRIDRNGVASVVGVGVGNIGVKSDENPEAKDSIVVEVFSTEDNIVEIEVDDPSPPILDEAASVLPKEVVKDNEPETIEMDSANDTVATVAPNATEPPLPTVAPSSNPSLSDSTNVEEFEPVSSVNILEQAPIQLPLGVEQELILHAVVVGGINGEIRWSATPPTSIENLGEGRFLFKGTEPATVTATSIEAPAVSATIAIEPVAPILEDRLILPEALNIGDLDLPKEVASFETYDFRLNAYNEQKVELVLPVILNILPGLGIGSFVQGDYAAGATLLTTEILGFTAMILSLAFPSERNNLLIGGGVATAMIRAGGILRTVVYTRNKNEPLHRLLGL